ncbi:sensor histidine kinase [Bifidobacterium tissieri]|uniref:Two-component sensor histidine kinase n=1 Tax=Bifidobacterium tissieri TaxID=1630162 RepID=A0A5M9ZYX6_9BIFI|nr:histidine kinase [Bifidobacterium tissieri]KAA8830778.1 two-component sensor histidine kinase [Bifidobacterium tissieri]KAA8832790.1 two-component sensor histidine kinase [Bifidobacterium tissieri]
MRAIGEQALLIAAGLTLVLTNPSAATMPFTVAGFLVSVAYAGLVEGLAPEHGRWLGYAGAGYAVTAVLFPQWCAFLPLIAYDCARSPAFFDARRWRRFIDRGIGLIWLVPLVVLLMRDGAVDGFGPSVPVIVTAVTLLGNGLGSARVEAHTLRRTLQRTQDRARHDSRIMRIRLSDIDEDRARAVRMATLGERTRIAREIHDNVGHLLTRAIMQAQAGKAIADATGDPHASQGYAALVDTLNDAMTMIRRSVHDLEDDGTDFSIQIADAVHSFSGVSPGFAVRLFNGIDTAPAPVARCLATVIRESLSNVVRHSKAKQATVTLRDFPAFWQLVVQDEGPSRHDGPADGGTGRIDSSTAGTDDDVEGLRGMGLSDIETRVRALGGTSLCGPYQGGWRVFVSLPKTRWSQHPSDAMR